MILKKYFKEIAKYILRSPFVIRKYTDEVERMYAMSSEELRQRNEARFLYIFRRAYTESPFYHRFYSEAGIKLEDIRGIDDLKKLPVLTKDMVKKHGKEMCIPGKRLINNHTSGTTGSPLNVWESWEAIYWEQAYITTYRRHCGFEYGKNVLASLRGNLSKHETTMWVHVSKTLFLSSYNLNPDTTEEYYRELLHRKPKAIEGYPGALYTLACNLEKCGHTLNIPVCFTSSESVLDYQRMKIEKIFHTEVFDHYGTTERTIQLMEDFEHNGYFEQPGYSINEYVPDGEITTGLINDCFPLIRYHGNDVVKLKDDYIFDVQKTTNAFVESIEGRTVSFLYGKDGTAYNDAALTFILKEGDSIKYAQFVQHKDGTIDLNIVPYADDIIESDYQHLLDLLDEKCGKGNLDIRINKVGEEQIIYSSRGKFSYVIREK